MKEHFGRKNKIYKSTAGKGVKGRVELDSVNSAWHGPASGPERRADDHPEEDLTDSVRDTGFSS